MKVKEGRKERDRKGMEWGDGREFGKEGKGMERKRVEEGKVGRRKRRDGWRDGKKGL